MVSVAILVQALSHTSCHLVVAGGYMCHSVAMVKDGRVTIINGTDVTVNVAGKAHVVITTLDGGEQTNQLMDGFDVVGTVPGLLCCSCPNGVDEDSGDGMCDFCPDRACTACMRHVVIEGGTANEHRVHFCPHCYVHIAATDEKVGVAVQKSTTSGGEADGKVDEEVKPKLKAEPPEVFYILSKPSRLDRVKKHRFLSCAHLRGKSYKLLLPDEVRKLETCLDCGACKGVRDYTVD